MEFLPKEEAKRKNNEQFAVEAMMLKLITTIASIVAIVISLLRG